MVSAFGHDLYSGTILFDYVLKSKNLKSSVIINDVKQTIESHQFKQKLEVISEICWVLGTAHNFF